MSVKLKVSYERPEELQELLERLQPMILSCRQSREQKGRYRRLYIMLKTDKKPIK